MLVLWSVFSVSYFMVLLTAMLSILVYIKSWMKRDDCKPKIICKESALSSHLLRKCSRLCKPFSPPLVLENRHVQTILPTIHSYSELEYDRVYIQLRDKGVVALDWVVIAKSNLRKKSPILLIIPQVARDATSVSKLCLLALSNNLRPVIFNRRGEGNSVLTTPRLRSYGDPCDLRQAIKYINGRYPSAIITCISYGSGSELLLSYLGEYGSSALVCACVCVSPCFDPAKRFSSRLRTFYDLIYLIRLKLSLCNHSRALSKNVDIHKALGSWRFDNYNETLYCKLYGYESMEEFWERNNPLRDASDIAVPVMCVSSQDDPFHTNIDIPYEVFKENPNLFLVSPEQGGHCGFIGDLSGESWADKLSIDFLEAVLEFSIKGYSVTRRHQTRSTI